MRYGVQELWGVVGCAGANRSASVVRLAFLSFLFCCVYIVDLYRVVRAVYIEERED